MAARKLAAKKPTAAQTLAALKKRALVISVYGPFECRTMIELPTDVATQLLGGPLERSGAANVIEGVEADLAVIAAKDPALAESALAATAIQLAYQLDHPFNSATSKSMCARSLLDAMERLRELAPESDQKDDVDDLSSRRAIRRARSAATAD